MVETFVEGDFGLPAEFALGDGDVGAAHLRVVAGQRAEHNLALATNLLDDLLGELEHRELTRVAEVDGAREVIVGRHHAQHTLDEVADILEGTRLLTVAVDGEVFAAQGLHHEVGDHPSVADRHAGTVGVEDTDDLGADTVQAVVVEEERLGAALALVVAGAQADGVDIAPVALRLRMDVGVAIDLAG